MLPRSVNRRSKLRRIRVFSFTVARGYEERCTTRSLAGQRDTTTQPHITRLTSHIPTLVQHASVPLPSSSLHSTPRLNFLLRGPFFDFITLYHHQSCSDADAEHIVVISMSHSIYTCNSVLAAALLIVLERRLGNFPIFSLIFPPLQLLTTSLILHRSQ
jgi:hypothetical protein